MLMRPHTTILGGDWTARISGESRTRGKHRHQHTEAALYTSNKPFDSNTDIKYVSTVFYIGIDGDGHFAADFAPEKVSVLKSSWSERRLAARLY